MLAPTLDLKKETLSQLEIAYKESLYTDDDFELPEEDTIFYGDDCVAGDYENVENKDTFCEYELKASEQRQRFAKFELKPALKNLSGYDNLQQQKINSVYSKNYMNERISYLSFEIR